MLFLCQHLCHALDDDRSDLGSVLYSLECDSDTFGAIAGGVSEEFYGGFGSMDAEGLLKKYLTCYRTGVPLSGS